MNLTVREMDGVNVVDVDGRIDSVESANELGDALKNCISEGKVKIIVNLEKVDYMNSSALGSLISARRAIKEKEDGGLKLAKLQSFVMEVFKKSQLIQMFDIVDTVEAGVESF
ncbi:MAG: STAS domain-containing protein [Candidatus Omnitrophica bacterium]|nr:STAS domain-containing protein [Candidatus Omnitrophota bacterium]